MVKVEIEKDKCIGCGACEAVCDNFELMGDGKAVVKQAEVEDIGCNKEAADVCPVKCIHIKE